MSKELEPKSSIAEESPVYKGTPSIWHLAEILTWLREDKTYSIDDSLLEVAITYGRLRQRQYGV